MTLAASILAGLLSAARCAGALVAVVLLLGSLAAHAEKRVALVVGNATYQNTATLANPRNDAEDMVAALRQVGFEVIYERDLNKRGMEHAIARFARAARDADAALFYYAGHGLQYRGSNYLMPVDAKLEDEFSLKFEMTRLDDVLSGLHQARGVKILVLDACRRNPLMDRLAVASTTRDFVATRGLARMDASRGMVVAYSTQADQLAVDGTGRNSPFTASLVKQITEPGLEIGTLFRRVAAEVNSATGGKQLPELSVSILGEFYFRHADSDVQAWSKIRASRDRAQLDDFVAKYSKSPLVADARERIDSIVRERQEREQPEKALQQQRLEQERIALEQAAQQQRLERERLAREQPARDEQARIERERQRQTAQTSVDKPPGETQVALLTPPAGLPVPGTPPLSSGALVQEVKKELRRVGCYAGPLDDKWPTRAATASLQKFAKHASVAALELTPELLDVLRKRPERTCPHECSVREVESDGRCVLKKCPAQQRLDRQGKCIAAAVATRRPSEPANSSSKCFTFSGKRYCE